MGLDKCVASQPGAPVTPKKMISAVDPFASSAVDKYLWFFFGVEETEGSVREVATVGQNIKPDKAASRKNEMRI